MMSTMGARRETDAELYAAHAVELVRFATVVAGAAGADDLVADAVVKAFTSRAWPTIEQRRAYLFQAVLNEARQASRSDQRRQRRERRAAEPELRDAPTPRPEVLQAIRGLDHRQRAIVFFTFWQDRTPGEIADELGITVRTVQRELSSARQHLTLALGEETR
jgi:RNA polymerase sigma factor (sigma-70 family)